MVEGAVIRESVVTDWRPGHRAPGKVELGACQLLRRLAAEVPADQAVVELGAYQGRSTGWLLLGAQDGHGAHVTTVDPWGTRSGAYTGRVRAAAGAEAEFQAHMAAIGATDAVLTVRRELATSAAQQWAGPPVGLLWHDAGHGSAEVEADLRAWLPHLSPSAVVVLHDAARPTYGVVEGARRVLDAAGWDWPGQLIRWQRRPQRRGVLIVRRTL